MSNTETSPNIQTDDSRFPTLSSLRLAHSELLKRYRERENEPEILTEVRHFLLKGQATGVVLDSEDDRWVAQGILDYWNSLLYKEEREPFDATLTEFDPSLVPTLDNELCPYMGLEAFRLKDQKLFFGRKRLTDKLLKHLESNQLLIVVGSSGSGKSSIVLGGLLPELLSGAIPGSKEWFYYAPIVPGSDPLSALAQRIKPANMTATEWVAQTVLAFKQNPNHLVEVTSQPDAQPVVLVIDQFEEVFTLCRDAKNRQALVDNLLNFIQTSNVRNRLILTMRSDFESQLVRTPDLIALFEQSHIRVTALDAGELRETIEKPAELVGLKFEEGLVEALLNDVLGEPTALPLLQFTLLKLWENRSRNWVTWEIYRQLGGGRLALARSADEFFDKLITEEQHTVRRILLHMVRPSEGLEVTSKRILRKGLYLAGEAEDRLDRVLQKLTEEHLIRLTEDHDPDDVQVEIAHEALIRNWPRLIDWLEAERGELRKRYRITDLAEQWSNNNKDRDLLLRGKQLKEAKKYDDLNDLEFQFVQESQQEESHQFEEKQRLQNVALEAYQEKLKDIKEIAEIELKPDIKSIRGIIRELSKLQDGIVDKEQIASSSLETSSVLVLDPKIIEEINYRLSVIQELQKLHQFPKTLESNFNQLKNKVQTFQQIDQNLKNINFDADRILQEGMELLQTRLRELVTSREENLLEASSQACLKEQIEILMQFQEELRYGQIVARWLERQRSQNLAHSLGDYALAAYPQIRNNASPRRLEAFYFTIEQFLERLSHCLIWGRSNNLDNPSTPIVLSDEVYITTFEHLKNSIPAHLPTNGVEQLKEYIDYLIARLPEYRHLAID